MLVLPYDEPLSGTCCVPLGKWMDNGRGRLWVRKMKQINKENLQKKLTLHLDRKSYLRFLKEITPIAKKAEYRSNPKNLKYTVVLNSVRIPYINCKGITSRIVDKNGKITHCGFFDWDNILEELLLDEVRYLSRLINSPIYIFKTSEKTDVNKQKYGNYIGIALIKKPFFDWIEINKQLHTDIAHSIVAQSYRYKCFVLRMSGKILKNGNNLKPRPEFKCVIDNNKKSFPGEISNAHKKFLEAYYPEIKKKNKKYKFKLDKNKLSDLYLTNYKTGST